MVTDITESWPLQRSMDNDMNLTFSTNKLEGYGGMEWSKEWHATGGQMMKRSKPRPKAAQVT